MNPQMMPPPLPGYPGAPPQGAPVAPPPAAAGGYPMPAPPAQPQGYPGPAVAAPAPAAAAPYPVYAQQPAQAQPPPSAYAPQAQPGYAPVAVSDSLGDIGAAIAAATGGDRVPRLAQGQYLLEILDTIVTQHPIEKYLTFKARFKVLESTSALFPVGSEGSYIEGLAYGSGRVQDFLIGASGFPSKVAYDQTLTAGGRDPKLELRALGNAAGNPATQSAQSHYPPNPLGGRRVRCVAQEYDKVAGAKSRTPGVMKHVHNYIWSPA